jgi:hypothetical protein
MGDEGAAQQVPVTPPCCPENSHGAAVNEGYINKGALEMLGDLQVYVARPDAWAGGKAILALHDVFGPDR